MGRLTEKRKKEIEALEEIDVCDACRGEGEVCEACPINPEHASFLEKQAEIYSNEGEI